MDFLKKAQIRITNWIGHNEHHQEEYELFADRLEREGKKEIAIRIIEMAALTAKSNEALSLALEVLEKDDK